MIVEHREAVVVGSGLAGLTAALGLAPLETVLITKTDQLPGGSSPWAQGGIAVPLDEADKALHVRDTLESGGSLANPEAVTFLVDQAQAARQWLEDQGVRFDRDPSGAYQRGQEGAHSARRILQVGADGTGAGLVATLVQRLTEAPWVSVRPRTLAVQLLPGGLLTLEDGRGLVLIRSPRILLAGGGLGQLFPATTAPAEATGDTIALALEAGLAVADLEMVQFHPTALATRASGAPSLSLLTEALRGEGARLVTADRGQETRTRPLEIDHPMGSLGPRDVLSRAIFQRQFQGHPVWLDARSVPETARRFPTVTNLCRAVGLDPARDLLPVVPAVHYTMGGVVTDLLGRTSRPGVWVAGEAARTGVHGANRLASNSLLECVVFGRAASSDALTSSGTPLGDGSWSGWPLPDLPTAVKVRSGVQAALGLAAGPVRNHASLEAGLATVGQLRATWDQAAAPGSRIESLTFDEARAILEARNLLLLAPELLTRAVERRASLGAHYRSDSPATGGPR